MRDWNKLTVAKLKEECAERDISLTGLKLKKHFIDKLEEWEASHESESKGEAQVEGLAETDDREPQPEPEDIQRDEAPDNDVAQVVKDPEEAAQADTVQSEEPIAEPADSGHVAEQPIPEPSAPKSEGRTPSDDHAEPTGAEVAEVKGSENATEHAQVPLQADSQEQKSTIEMVAPASSENPQSGTRSSSNQTPVSASAQPPATGDTTRSSSIVPPAEASEDARKRKRRSVTPTPQAEEIALKKLKANDGSPLIRAQAEAESEQAAINEAGVDADAGPLAHEQPAADRELDPPVEPQSDQPPPVRSPSPAADQTVAPALHSATSTLYIRNFKRPLRQPDLQTHIASLGRSSRDDPDANPIKFFYLDVIRTHAFVRLHSVSAAARVRSAIHNTRWPDEPNRELLWVDFIPDDKAEAWANQEADASAGSGFGSRGGSSKRWEVTYREGPGGTEAILQDANDVRAGPQQRQPSFSQARKTSSVVDRDLAPGIHPERATLLPNTGARTSSRAYDDHPRPPQQPKNAERSFAALDELFSSTEKTKPKLYYKPVAPEVVDQRLELIKDLRVGHNGMGRSGDEGMKRYTFELERGREEWVDKGPEFGFGRKGLDRLAGDRGRGGRGYRGRGGGLGHARGGGGGGGGGGYQDWDAPPPVRRGGDSWRGGR